MSSALASLCVCLKGEMQQVCLQALVTALVEPLLLSSSGLDTPWPAVPELPELLIHLLSLGHVWHVLGAGLAGVAAVKGENAGRATPAWQQPMCGGSFPPSVVSFDMLEVGVCLFPDCVLCELACAQLW